MGPGVVQMPAGKQVPLICDVAMPRAGLLGVLRALRARPRLGWLVRAAQRAAKTPERQPSAIV